MTVICRTARARTRTHAHTSAHAIMHSRAHTRSHAGVSGCPVMCVFVREGGGGVVCVTRRLAAARTLASPRKQSLTPTRPRAHAPIHGQRAVTAAPSPAVSGLARAQSLAACCGSALRGRLPASLRHQAGRRIGAPTRPRAQCCAGRRLAGAASPRRRTSRLPSYGKDCLAGAGQLTGPRARAFRLTSYGFSFFSEGALKKARSSHPR